MMEAGPIIYFDGVCNLCESSVQFILKIDKRKVFRFASLQGKAGEEMQRKYGIYDFNSFVLEDNGKVYTKSTGALKVLRLVGGAWSLSYALIILPPFIRDGIYEFISKRRYNWFGKKTECWVPTPELRKRFLD
jgi:predicted DCC family thiol-disulfide oxidoreductase YuxK